MESTSSGVRAALRRTQSPTEMSYSGFLDKPKTVVQKPPQNEISCLRYRVPAKINQKATESFSRSVQNIMQNACPVKVPKKGEHATSNLKGRIQHFVEKLETLNKKLDQDRHLYDKKIAALEKENYRLNNDVVVKLEKKLRDQEEELRSTVGKKDREIKELSCKIESYKQHINWLKSELEASRLERSTFRTDVNNLTASQLCLQAQFEATKQYHKELDSVLQKPYFGFQVQSELWNKYLLQGQGAHTAVSTMLDTFRVRDETATGETAIDETATGGGEANCAELPPTFVDEDAEAHSLPTEHEENNEEKEETREEESVRNYYNSEECAEEVSRINKVTTGGSNVASTTVYPAHMPHAPPQSFITSGSKEYLQSDVMIDQRRLDIRKVKNSDLFKEYFRHRRHFVPVPNIFLPWTTKQWKLELRAWKRRMRSSI